MYHHDHQDRKDRSHRSQQDARGRHRLAGGPDRHPHRAHPSAHRAPEGAPERQAQPSGHVQDGVPSAISNISA